MFSRIILLIAALLGAPLAVAAPDLYEDTAWVESEASEERQRVMGEMLKTLLVRVSGVPEITAVQEMRETLTTPESYVAEYRYDRLRDGLRLWVRFEREAIARLLTRHGFELWREDRDAVLVWLAVDEAGNRYLVGSGSKEPVRQQLESRARTLGLPLLLPLMDLEDQARINFAEVWGNFEDRIAAASARYTPEAIVTARLQQMHHGGEWVLDWSFRSGGLHRRWEMRSTDVNAVLNDALAQTVATLSRGGMAMGDQNEHLVLIEGISTIEDYARMSETIRGIGGVSDHRVYAAIAPDIMVLALTVRGRFERVAQALRLNRALRGTTVELPPQFDASMPQFRLVP